MWRWRIWPTWTLVAVDHFSSMATVVCPLEGPTAGWVVDALGSAFLGHRPPKHIITDQEGVFICDVFGELLRHWNLKQRFGAVGKQGSNSICPSRRAASVSGRSAGGDQRSTWADPRIAHMAAGITASRNTAPRDPQTSFSPVQGYPRAPPAPATSTSPRPSLPRRVTLIFRAPPLPALPLKLCACPNCMLTPLNDR